MPIKRPLTPDELNQLEAEGYNTSKYKGELIEFPDPEKQSTAAGAGFRAALANLLPATAGAAGFAGGAEAGAALGAFGGPAAPITVPVGGLVGGVIGSALASGATAKIQDVALPKAATDKLALDAAEHPLATKVGGVAAMLPTMRPSLSVTRDALGAIPQLFAPAAGKTVVNRAGMEALKQVGLGAGISGATEIGRQAIAGDFDAGKILGETAIGAAFNKPTALGHIVMRSSPAAPRVVDDPEALIATIAKIQPTPEEIAALKEANEAKKNVNKTAKEVLKAQKLAQEQADIKKGIEEAKKEGLKVKEEPVKKAEAPAKAAEPAEVSINPAVAVPVALLGVNPNPVMVTKPEVPTKIEVTHKIEAPISKPVEQQTIKPVVAAPVKPTLHPDTMQLLLAKGYAPEMIARLMTENTTKILAPKPVEVPKPVAPIESPARPSIASTAPSVPVVKTPTKPKQSADDFYASKRIEHKAAIDRITEAWHEVVDTGNNKPLEDVVAEYGGKGPDIFALSGRKPESNEFVDAVMKLRGDRSKPEKAAPETKVAPVVEKPVEPPEPTEREQRAAELGIDLDEPLNQKNENIQTPLGKEVSGALAKQKKSTTPTTAYKSAVGEIDRGLPKTKEDITLPSKGQFDPITGQRTVNPTTETLDTRPHETAHDLIRTIYDAKAKGSKRASDYLAKLERTQQEGLDAYNAERAKKSLPPVNHEEFATSQQGHEFLKQQLNLNKETKWKKWWNDTKALYNTAYGKNPSIEDLRRVLNFRFVNENVGPREFAKGAEPVKPAATIIPFKNAKEKDAAIKSIKTPEEAEAVIGRLKAERENIAKEGLDVTLDADARHKVVSKMMANKMDIQHVSDKHGLKNVDIKYQENEEGLPLTPPAGYRPITIKRPDGTTYDAFFNDKYYDMGEHGKFASIAKLTDSGELTHGATRKGEEIIEKGEPTLKQESNTGLTHVEKDSDILPPDPTKQSFFRFMSSTFDRVAEVDPKIAQAARDYENRKSSYQGMANAALIDLSKFKRADVDKVMAEHRKAYREDDYTPELNGPKDAQISKILSDYYGKIADIRRNSGLLIDGRQGGKDQYYVPDMMNAKTADVFTNNPLSDEARQLKEDWADHILSHDRAEGITREDVLRDINEYIGAMGGKSNNYKSLEFGAIRKASGYGLPEHMRETDGINALSRYSRRAASDLAFFQEIQNKPDIAGPLHIKDQNGDVPAEYQSSAYFQDKRIKDMMKWITNDIGGANHNSPLLRSTVRLINNALLGPATGIRDLVSVPMNALPYIHRFSDLGAAWKGMMAMRDNSRAALETGARQPQIDKVAFDDVLEGPNRFANIVGKVADGLRKYQGREAIENLSRDITFSIGKELGRNNIIGAKAGNAQSKAWLKKFGDLVEGNILTKSGDELEAALNQIGKNFTDRNQGTYGGRGLPVGIVDNQFAPFFALQKWSVEKANVIYKDVYKPFMTGENRLPMLTYTLGSIMTGAAIQQLNQLMSGKKGIDPTVKEALDKGNAASITQELATLMQLGSYAGIMSDGVKTIADTTLRGRVPRNVVSFPTATAAVKTGESLTDMAEAIRQGEDHWKVLKAFALDAMTTNIQAMRMLANHTINDEETDRKDKFRDVRVFNELEGKSAGDITKTNPYLGLDAKEFKKSNNLQEATGMAGDLVKKAATKSGGSVEQFRSSLASLKGNSYQTMPSPKDSPEEFKRYYDFLVRTQGIDEANARVKDYVMQTTMNKAKAKLIP